MTTAIRSVFTGGVAVAGAAVMAATPLAPTVDLQVPRLASIAVALTSEQTAPPIGALPYQTLVNGIADVLALAPIVFGSTEQCTACIGPVANPNIPSPAIPFSGWGIVGIGAGLLTAPVALVQTLVDTLNVGEALGAALAAVQTPITNTFTLLGAPRAPFGGFALQGVLDRAFDVTKDITEAVLNIAAQALVSGPLAVLGGLTEGVQTFALTLASTGNIVAAFQAGIAPVQVAVNESVDNLVHEVGKNRIIINNAQKAGPGRATSPIPTITPPPVASVRAAAAVTAPQQEAPQEQAAPLRAREVTAAAPAAAARTASSAAAPAAATTRSAGTAEAGAPAEAAADTPKRSARAAR